MRLNQELENMGVYASKNISQKAKHDPRISNLSFGEPVFGPPPMLKSTIVEKGLSYDTFLSSVKRYEDPQGSFALRQSISGWYSRNYGLDVDPETEIMITHGGVESITLAILSISSSQDEILVSQPSYMLYQRTIQALTRTPLPLVRNTGEHQYEILSQRNRAKSQHDKKVSALIINSPENPSGYILSGADWVSVSEYIQNNDTWLIHDEVYDTMAFERSHVPAWCHESIKEKSIMINSFSKKFGLPGLRIGWMVAPKRVIELAAKIHDYMYLGVNIQYETIADLIIKDHNITDWLNEQKELLRKRAIVGVQSLSEKSGYLWDRRPYGAMFLFPNVSGIYPRIPAAYRAGGASVGEAVSNYLFNERKVAVVPGYVYGDGCKDHIRLVTCGTDDVFNSAIGKLILEDLK